MGLSTIKKIIAALGCASLLLGCDRDVQDQAPPSSRSSVYDDAKLTKDNGFYVHIKAVFEVIKTDEVLDFDYVISCYNREVPGSFHGILKPKIMFKATSSGEAMAIVPPEHYCERGLRGKPLEDDRDPMVIPQVTWYPDVNDLSFAITYMSDDAYKNPNAHIRFKSYAFGKTDKAHFQETTKRIDADYEQIGAIPGPFGCADEDVKHTDEYACHSDERQKRNNGYYIIFADEKQTDSHVRTYPVPDALIAAIRRLPHGQGRYYCEGGRTKNDGEAIPSIRSFVRRSEFNDSEKKLTRDFFNIYHSTRSRQYLSWDVVEESSSNITSKRDPVGTLYPFVQHGKKYYIDFSNGRKFTKPEEENFRYDTIQILYDERWRGFGIEQSQDIVVHRPDLAIDFTEPKSEPGRAIFINGAPVCIGGLPYVIYDLEEKIVFKLQR